MACLIEPSKDFPLILNGSFYREAYTLTVYPESDSTILFQVDANGGAPAYNMANVFGRAHLRGDTAT